MSIKVTYLAPVAEYSVLNPEGLLAESYSDGGIGVWTNDSYME